MATTKAAFPRRATDRLQDVVALVLMVSALVLVIAAGVVGVSVHAGQSRRAEVENASRTLVSAVLLHDAARDGDYATTALPVRVAAQWPGPAGQPRTGPVLAPIGAKAGTAVTAWLDRAGQPVAPPSGWFEAVLAAVLAAIAVLVLGGVALAATWAGTRQAVESANHRYWEREWARIEPTWCPGRSTGQD